MCIRRFPVVIFAQVILTVPAQDCSSLFLSFFQREEEERIEQTYLIECICISLLAGVLCCVSAQFNSCDSFLIASLDGSHFVWDCASWATASPWLLHLAVARIDLSHA